MSLVTAQKHNTSQDRELFCSYYSEGFVNPSSESMKRALTIESLWSFSGSFYNTATFGKGTVLYPGYNIMVNGNNNRINGYNIRGTQIF